jgi:hypothetical protein
LVTILLGLLGIWTATAVPPTTTFTAESIATPAVSGDRWAPDHDSGLEAQGSGFRTRGSKWAVAGSGASPGDEQGGGFAETADGDALSEETRRIDVYGNEIEAAFEDYRIDVGGEIYESHSPDTAVHRLPSAGV